MHVFGLWITVVEFVVLLAIATVMLSLRWALTQDGRTAVADHARQALLFAATVAVVTAIAVVLDGPGAGVLTPAYDRISIVHLTLTGVAAVAWMMLAAIGRRAPYAGSAAGRVALLAAIGLCAIAAMATVFPLFFLGPMAGVDPRVAAIIGNAILEMQPLYPDTPGRLALFLRHMGAGLIGVPMLIWVLVRRGEPERRWQWAYLAIGLAVTTALSLAYFRFSSLFTLLIAFPLAAFIGISFEASGTRLPSIAGTLARSVSVLAILMSPVMLEVAGKRLFANPGSGALVAANCPDDDIAPLLNDAGGVFARPRIILSNSLALATAIIYRTPHAVVATLYFGNVDGIVDANTVFTASEDAAARAVIDRRGIGAIIICRAAGRSLWRAGTDGGVTLHQRLLADDPPPWLRPVPLPDQAASRFCALPHRADATALIPSCANNDPFDGAARYKIYAALRLSRRT